MYADLDLDTPIIAPPVAHPARAIVYLCTKEADDLAGKEFSLRDEDFRRRIGLAG